MDKDKIIRMAIDTGLGEYLHLEGWRFTPDGDDIKSLERFFHLAFAAGAAHEREKHRSPSWETVDDAIAAEREACAKVCEKAAIQMNYSEAPYKQCAAAIRGLK